MELTIINSVLVNWFDKCPRCGCKEAIITGRGATISNIREGFTTQCIQCSNEGETVSYGNEIVIEWWNYE